MAFMIEETIFSILKSEPKTFYNAGVGHRPHNESYIFKKKYPNIKCYGLEPQFEVFLDRKTDYCGELYPWGLWSEHGLFDLNTTIDKGHSSILSADHIKVNVTHKQLISCTTLDIFDKAVGEPQDIFLWLDIEGAEFEALKGAKELLASKRLKWIDLEVSHKPRRKDDMYVEELHKYLLGFGYNMIKKYGVHGRHHNRLYAL